VGVDIDPEKIRKVNVEIAPVDKALLSETIANGQGRLRATNNPAEAVQPDVCFFIPPSPLTKLHW